MSSLVGTHPLPVGMYPGAQKPSNLADGALGANIFKRMASARIARITIKAVFICIHKY